MSEQNPKYILPHHQLIAFSVAKELVLAVIAAKISDATLSDQALRAAKERGAQYGRGRVAAYGGGQEARLCHRAS